ncbi:hypothetical protein DFH27DRAFT_524785 [Peziza echinospora]|nr:hypothetical protein DFH27DRAFT_524785 [Peziza echinospora]
MYRLQVVSCLSLQVSVSCTRLGGSLAHTSTKNPPSAVSTRNLKFRCCRPPTKLVMLEEVALEAACTVHAAALGMARSGQDGHELARAQMLSTQEGQGIHDAGKYDTRIVDIVSGGAREYFCHVLRDGTNPPARTYVGNPPKTTATPPPTTTWPQPFMVRGVYQTIDLELCICLPHFRFLQYS